MGYFMLGLTIGETLVLLNTAIVFWVVLDFNPIEFIKSIVKGDKNK